MSKAKSGLRSSCLSPIEVMGQSIANIAPSACPALALAAVFGSAGKGTWFAFLFATITIVLIGVCINMFAKRSATPGALYTYVSQGLGSASGFISGSGLVLAYVLTGTAVLGGFANYANNVLGYVGINIPPIILFIFAAATGWFITYRDVQLSAKLMLTIEGCSLLLSLILAVVIFATRGFSSTANQISLTGVTPDNIRLGLVLAFFAFVGFESATALGHEAKNPLKNVPRAVLGSAAFVGIFFVIMSFAMVTGFVGSKTALNMSPAPIAAVAAAVNVPALGLILSIGIMVSFWSCNVACITAAARVMLTMSKQGILPQPFGKTHKTNDTPHVSLTISAVFGLAVTLIMGAFGIDGISIFNYAGTVGTLGFIVAYILVAIAAPVYLHKIKKLKVVHVIVAAITVVLSMVPLVGSVYPVPAFPFNILPIILLGWLLLSGVWYAAYIHGVRATKRNAELPNYEAVAAKVN
jgi:amino acid transporter